MLVYFTSFTVCSGDIEKAKKSSKNELKKSSGKKAPKKTLKKNSENDQSTGHFQSFLLVFFVPRTLNMKKNPINQLIKTSGLKLLNINEKQCGHRQPSAS